MATNTVYVFKKKSSKYAFTSEIRSCLENSSRPTSSMWVNMLARGGQVSGSYLLFVTMVFLHQWYGYFLVFWCLIVIIFLFASVANYSSWNSGLELQLNSTKYFFNKSDCVLFTFIQRMCPNYLRQIIWKGSTKSTKFFWNALPPAAVKYLFNRLSYKPCLLITCNRIILTSNSL